MKSRVHRKVALAAAAASLIGTALIIGGTSAVSAASTRSGTVALAASRPSFLAHATDMGPVAATQRVDFEVLLSYPDEAAVEAEAQAVSTPHNALYRHFLTTAQFRARYSPSEASGRRRSLVGPRRRAFGGVGSGKPAVRRGHRDDGASREVGRHPPRHLSLPRQERERAGR